MTGRELLEALSRLSEEEIECEVASEGCDCYGNVSEVEVDTNPWKENKVIYLRRSGEF